MAKKNKTKIIAICNQKGGVGKTTTAVNLAAFLAATENSTLVVDMDPQANCTSGLGVKVGSYKESVYDVIIGKKDIDECILNSKLDFWSRYMPLWLSKLYPFSSIVPPLLIISVASISISSVPTLPLLQY